MHTDSLTTAPLSQNLISPKGAILSTVTRANQHCADENVFVTAIWLRELRMQNLHQFAGFDHIKNAALNYLESSADEHDTFGPLFGFWPTGQVPNWAGNLGADLDDTSIALNELFHANRLNATKLKPKLFRLLARSRFDKTKFSPSWAKSGCYVTWIDSEQDKATRVEDEKKNIIDACVNTNVVALLAALQAKHAPGYASACETVCSAIAWAAAKPTRWQAIIPYYPNPMELKFAVEHAVACGAHELTEALSLMKSLELFQQDIAASNAEDGGLCCGAYGAPIWHSFAVQNLRRQRFDFFQRVPSAHGGLL